MARSERRWEGGNAAAGGSDQGGMGDAEVIRSRPGLGKSGQEQDRDGITSASVWSRFVWTPCADSKLRRSPALPVSLVNGLRMELPDELGTPWAARQEDRPHRSLLGALGNSVVWQVAAELIRAIMVVMPR